MTTTETVLRSSTWPSRLRLSAALACLLGPFWPAIHQLFLRWASDDNSYCYLIVPLFLSLCWERRQELRATPVRGRILSLAMAAIAVLCVLLGELASAETLIFFGLWGGLISLLVTAYGIRCRALAFPALILLFIIPLPPFINELITFNFKLLASRISAEALRLFGTSVLLEGNILDLGTTQLEVADACSGLRYLMSLVLLALLMGHYFSKRWWQHLVLLGLVFPLLILLNSARVFLIALLTVNGHAELSHGLLHDLTGILFFGLAGAIFYAVTRLFATIQPAQRPRGQAAIPCQGGGRHASSWHIGLLCLIFLVGGLLAHKIPASSQRPAREQFSSFPLTLGQWQGERQSLSDNILASLWADDYLDATFTNRETRDVIRLLIPYYAYQGTRHTAHAPQSCLLGGGFALHATRDRDVVLKNGRRITVTTMEMSKGERKLLATYFFLQRGRVITSPWLNKFYLLVDSIKRNRTDGALLRIEMTMPVGRSFEDGYALQDGFIRRLWPLLRQYIPE